LEIDGGGARAPVPQLLATPLVDAVLINGQIKRAYVRRPTSVDGRMRRARCEWAFIRTRLSLIEDFVDQYRD